MINSITPTTMATRSKEGAAQTKLGAAETVQRSAQRPARRPMSCQVLWASDGVAYERTAELSVCVFIRFSNRVGAERALLYTFGDFAGDTIFPSWRGPEKDAGVLWTYIA